MYKVFLITILVLIVAVYILWHFGKLHYCNIFLLLLSMIPFGVCEYNEKIKKKESFIWGRSEDTYIINKFRNLSNNKKIELQKLVNNNDEDMKVIFNHISKLNRDYHTFILANIDYNDRINFFNNIMQLVIIPTDLTYYLLNLQIKNFVGINIDVDKFKDVKLKDVIVNQNVVTADIYSLLKMLINLIQRSQQFNAENKINLILSNYDINSFSNIGVELKDVMNAILPFNEITLKKFFQNTYFKQLNNYITQLNLNNDSKNNLIKEINALVKYTSMVEEFLDTLKSDQKTNDQLIDKIEQNLNMMKSDDVQLIELKNEIKQYRELEIRRTNIENAGLDKNYRKEVRRINTGGVEGYARKPNSFSLYFDYNKLPQEEQKNLRDRFYGEYEAYVVEINKNTSGKQLKRNVDIQQQDITNLDTEFEFKNTKLTKQLNAANEELQNLINNPINSNQKSKDYYNNPNTGVIKKQQKIITQIQKDLDKINERIYKYENRDNTSEDRSLWNDLTRAQDRFNELDVEYKNMNQSNKTMAYGQHRKAEEELKAANLAYNLNNDKLKIKSNDLLNKLNIANDILNQLIQEEQNTSEMTYYQYGQKKRDLENEIEALKLELNNTNEGYNWNKQRRTGWLNDFKSTLNNFKNIKPLSWEEWMTKKLNDESGQEYVTKVTDIRYNEAVKRNEQNRINEQNQSFESLGDNNEMIEAQEEAATNIGNTTMSGIKTLGNTVKQFSKSASSLLGKTAAFSKSAVSKLNQKRNNDNSIGNDDVDVKLLDQSKESQQRIISNYKSFVEKIVKIGAKQKMNEFLESLKSELNNPEYELSEDETNKLTKNISEIIDTYAFKNDFDAYMNKYKGNNQKFDNIINKIINNYKSKFANELNNFMKTDEISMLKFKEIQYSQFPTIKPIIEPIMNRIEQAYNNKLTNHNQSKDATLSKLKAEYEYLKTEYTKLKDEKDKLSKSNSHMNKNMKILNNITSEHPKVRELMNNVYQSTLNYISHTKSFMNAILQNQQQLHQTTKMHEHLIMLYEDILKSVKIEENEIIKTVTNKDKNFVAKISLLQNMNKDLTNKLNRLNIENKTLHNTGLESETVDSFKIHIKNLEKTIKEQHDRILTLHESGEKACLSNPKIENIRISHTVNEQVINAYKKLLQDTEVQVSAIIKGLKDRNQKLQFDINGLQRIILDNELKYKESLDAMISVNKINYESKLSMCNAQIGLYAKNAKDANAYSLKMDGDMTNYLKQKEEEIKKIYKQQIIDIELKLTTSINMIKRMEQELKHKDSIITQLSNKIKTLESTENQNSSKLKKYINIFNNIKNLPLDSIKQYVSKLDSFEDHERFINEVINSLESCNNKLNEANNKLQVCDFKTKIMKLNEELLINSDKTNMQSFIDNATVLQTELKQSAIKQSEESMLLDTYITRMINNMKSKIQKV